MKISISLLVLMLFALSGIAQDTIQGQVIRVDTIREVILMPAPPQSQQVDKKQQTEEAKKTDKMYFGGYANLSIGKYTVIGFEPMVGYKLTPKFSVGGKITYEYIKDKRYTVNQEASNYGLSAFSRYRIIPTLYAHTELSFMSYKLFYNTGESRRKLVPFFYVGGGYSVPITKNTWFTAEVLFDIWQHKNSPYKAWEPYFSAGFGIGF